jgi:hypothetical protein
VPWISNQKISLKGERKYFPTGTSFGLRESNPVFSFRLDVRRPRGECAVQNARLLPPPLHPVYTTYFWTITFDCTLQIHGFFFTRSQRYLRCVQREEFMLRSILELESSQRTPKKRRNRSIRAPGVKPRSLPPICRSNQGGAPGEGSVYRTPHLIWVLGLDPPHTTDFEPAFPAWS